MEETWSDSVRSFALQPPFLGQSQRGPAPWRLPTHRRTLPAELSGLMFRIGQAGPGSVPRNWRLQGFGVACLMRSTMCRLCFVTVGSRRQPRDIDHRPEIGLVGARVGKPGARELCKASAEERQALARQLREDLPDKNPKLKISSKPPNFPSSQPRYQLRRAPWVLGAPLP